MTPLRYIKKPIQQWSRILRFGMMYICVRVTALDAIKCSYRTTVIDDCCRGTDLNTIEEAKNDILKNNEIICKFRRSQSNG